MKEGYGICPVCNGSDEFKCTNCGGQYMYGTPKGIVRLNKEGLPCTHKYVGSNVGRCLTQYVCEHCSDRFQVDSGG